VADDHAGDAFRAQPAQQVQQVRGVLVVERGRGLVEDEQLDVLGQRLGDLHELLLADADVAHRGDRLLPQADAGEQPLGLVVGAVPVDQPAGGALVAEEDVLRDRELRAQGQLLVDDHDAAVLAVADRRERAHRALERDLAVVAAVRVHPRQHLHQRGLARAVLPADGVDLAAAHGQVDVRERRDAGEGLRDPFHPEDLIRTHVSWAAV
jgi:hypothetical protein